MVRIIYCSRRSACWFFLSTPTTVINRKSLKANLEKLNSHYKSPRWYLSHLIKRPTCRRLVNLFWYSQPTNDVCHVLGLVFSWWKWHITSLRCKCSWLCVMAPSDPAVVRVINNPCWKTCFSCPFARSSWSTPIYLKWNVTFLNKYFFCYKICTLSLSSISGNWFLTLEEKLSD